MSGPDKVRRRHRVLNVYSSEEASAARASRRCRLNPDFSIAFLNDFDVDNQRTNAHANLSVGGHSHGEALQPARPRAASRSSATRSS
jgi:hypothetical protein